MEWPKGTSGKVSYFKGGEKERQVAAQGTPWLAAARLCSYEVPSEPAQRRRGRLDPKKEPTLEGKT